MRIVDGSSVQQQLYWFPGMQQAPGAAEATGGPEARSGVGLLEGAAPGVRVRAFWRAFDKFVGVGDAGGRAGARRGEVENAEDEGWMARAGPFGCEASVAAPAMGPSGALTIWNFVAPRPEAVWPARVEKDPGIALSGSFSTREATGGATDTFLAAGTAAAENWTGRIAAMFW